MYFALLTAFAGVALADWQYPSRPDLSPPVLNITIPATDDISPGYIFVGIFPGGGTPRSKPEQPAPYILSNDGDLVWSGLGYFGAGALNFHPTTYKGKTILQAIEGTQAPLHGRGWANPVLFDDHYQTIAYAHARSNKIIDAHEFEIHGGKTALVGIYQPTVTDLSPYGATNPEQQWLSEAIVQEFDLETGEVLFEVEARSFASPHDSVVPIGGSFSAVNTSDAWDWFHINSVHKDDEENFIISSRHTSAVYKLNGTDGSLIWQLGGINNKSTFALADGLTFGLQHDARFLNRSVDGTIETISIFDNSVPATPHSSARIIELDYTSYTATQIGRYLAPNNIFAASAGSAQVIPETGHVFANWGNVGAITEFRADGTPIFHAYLDSNPDARGALSYRGFRYEWSGYSNEPPALAALKGEDQVSIFVSWNGDTQVTSWQFFYSASEGGDVVELGESTRTSFETSIAVDVSDLPELESVVFWAEGYQGEELLTTTGFTAAIEDRR
jgi:hypothetical protein